MEMHTAEELTKTSFGEVVTANANSEMYKSTGISQMLVEVIQARAPLLIYLIWN
jgi:hypothetical protein